MLERIRSLRYLISALAISAAFSLVCFAQQAAGNARSAPAQAAPAKEWPADRIGGFMAEWTRAKNWSKEYIDKMPEDAMGFKPVPEVRSFAEQMLHLASANFFFGARITGQANPYQGKDLLKMDELKTKAALSKVVMESYDFMINGLKGVNNAKLDERITSRGISLPLSEVVVIAFEHQTHHRGQTTIYLRMKGVVPPPEPF